MVFEFIGEPSFECLVNCAAVAERAATHGQIGPFY
jgi:hypothetical protein